ncbi:hypothetical protein CPB83DRAFT_857667 [Crepidotus variabilis]|uniref:Uncharacterized protein n=1 Tax=Crepidotus variabilis TaxID=179855 RepID=A0A9P6JNE2_9AGAR|nr:hypothetical protein CPB83DRAFT_857667 [Crepidotus variabilis]
MPDTSTSIFTSTTTMSNSDNVGSLSPISNRELVVATHDNQLPQVDVPSPDLSNTNHSLELLPFPMPLTQGAYHLTPDTPEIRWKDFAAYPSPLPPHDSSSDDTESNASSGKSRRDKAKRMARAKKELLMVKHWFGKSKNNPPTESSSEGRRGQ